MNYKDLRTILETTFLSLKHVKVTNEIGSLDYNLQYIERFNKDDVFSGLLDASLEEQVNFFNEPFFAWSFIHCLDIEGKSTDELIVLRNELKVKFDIKLIDLCMATYLTSITNGLVTTTVHNVDDLPSTVQPRHNSISSSGSLCLITKFKHPDNKNLFESTFLGKISELVGINDQESEFYGLNVFNVSFDPLISYSPIDFFIWAIKGNIKLNGTSAMHANKSYNFGLLSKDLLSDLLSELKLFCIRISFKPNNRQVVDSDFVHLPSFLQHYVKDVDYLSLLESKDFYIYILQLRSMLRRGKYNIAERFNAPELCSQDETKAAETLAKLKDRLSSELVDTVILYQLKSLFFTSGLNYRTLFNRIDGKQQIRPFIGTNDPNSIFYRFELFSDSFASKTTITDAEFIVIMLALFNTIKNDTVIKNIESLLDNKIIDDFPLKMQKFVDFHTKNGEVMQIIKNCHLWTLVYDSGNQFFTNLKDYIDSMRVLKLGVNDNGIVIITNNMESYNVEQYA